MLKTTEPDLSAKEFVIPAYRCANCGAGGLSGLNTCLPDCTGQTGLPSGRDYPFFTF